MMNVNKTPVTLAVVAWMIAVGAALAVEPQRVWVDAQGNHTVEARLIEVVEGDVQGIDGQEAVRLLRGDGSTVVIAVDQLSSRDQRYIRQFQQRSGTRPVSVMVDRDRSRRRPPQPLLDLPPARVTAEEGTALKSENPRALQTLSGRPESIPADPPLWVFGAIEARIPIAPVDVYSICSRPIPIIAADENGDPKTVVVMSISKTDGTLGSTGPALWNSRNQLVQFDIDANRATVPLRHDESIKLLDHHHDSGRSLLHVGYDSLGKGGALTVASGWGIGDVTLSHRRSLEDARDESLPAQLHWAAWIDEEHVMALVDHTLVLWNLISGKQIYAIDGVDPRGVPALSGGRRIVAVPAYGEVQLMTTWNGESLGRIETPREVPGVSFSTESDRLAIATSREMLIWDLPAGSLSERIPSKRSLGTGQPVWLNPDQVLSSSGVLIDRTLALPVWRYDLVAAEAIAMEGHLVAFRRHPRSELAISGVPHRTVAAALRWIARENRPRDAAQWELPGRSQWGPEGWDDQQVQITANGDSRR